MAKYIRQSIAAETQTIKIGPFISIIDLTVLASATILATSVYLSKNGAELTQKHEGTNPTVDRDGYYTVTLDATDLATLGRLRIESPQTNYLMAPEDFIILSQANYDAEVAATGVSKYDLIDAPNATAVTAINAALSARIPAALDANGNISANVKAVTVAPARTITTNTTLYGEVYGSVNPITIDNSTGDVTLKINAGKGYLNIIIASNAHLATIYTYGFNGTLYFTPNATLTNQLIVYINGFDGTITNGTAVGTGCAGNLYLISGKGQQAWSTNWTLITKTIGWLDITAIKSSTDAAITENALLTANLGTVDTGFNVLQTLKELLAKASGKIVKTGDGYAYYDKTNTLKFTLTEAGDTVTRS